MHIKTHKSDYCYLAARLVERYMLTKFRTRNVNALGQSSNNSWVWNPLGYRYKGQLLNHRHITNRSSSFRQQAGSTGRSSAAPLNSNVMCMAKPWSEKRNHVWFSIWIDNHMSKLWRVQNRDYANRFLPMVLRVHSLWCSLETAPGWLLRFLFIWFG